MDNVIASRAAQDAEAARVRGRVEGLLVAGTDVVVYTTRALRQVLGLWMVMDCEWIPSTVSNYHPPRIKYSTSKTMR